MPITSKPKIQTMKDDLREIEEKLMEKSAEKRQYENPIVKYQQEILVKTKKPEIFPIEEKKDAESQLPKPEDEEVKKLKNIINRVLQTEVKEKSTEKQYEKENAQYGKTEDKELPEKKDVFGIGSKLEKTVDLFSSTFS